MLVNSNMQNQIKNWRIGTNGEFTRMSKLPKIKIKIKNVGNQF